MTVKGLLKYKIEANKHRSQEFYDLYNNECQIRLLKIRGAKYLKVIIFINNFPHIVKDII